MVLKVKNYIVHYLKNSVFFFHFDKSFFNLNLTAKDSCGGDSGGKSYVYKIIQFYMYALGRLGNFKCFSKIIGPLVYPITLNGEGKFFQLGVVSFGPVQCGVGGLPGEKNK